MRLINPSSRSTLNMLQTASKPTAVLPYVDENLSIDPGTLKLYHYDGKGEPPQTDGTRPNFPHGCMKQPIALCLSVTRACNLRCRYCYVKNRKMSGADMSVATAMKALEFVQPQKISFFGGEPLLRWDLIQTVTERTPKAHHHITTNGTLLTAERAKWLAGQGFSLIVSLDGPEELHNLNRPGRDGNSFQRTLQALEHVKKAGLGKRTTLRATYTRDCVHLRERLAFLNDFVQRGYAGAVSVESVSSTEASCVSASLNEKIAVTPVDEDSLLHEYREAFDWILRQVRQKKSVRWHHLNTFARRLSRREPAPTECGAAKGYISVTPDGQIYACHREAGEPIGHVNTGIDEMRQCKWLGNRWFNRPQCRTCWARNVCGGGCRADSLIHNGDIHKPFAVNCMVVQLVIAHAAELLHRLSPREWKYII